MQYNLFQVDSQGIEYIFHTDQVSALHKINNTDSSGRDYRIWSHWASFRLEQILLYFMPENPVGKPRHRWEHNIKMYIRVSSWLDSSGSRHGPVIEFLQSEGTSWQAERISGSQVLCSMGLQSPNDVHLSSNYSLNRSKEICVHFLCQSVS
jgi:hypothetical protein